MAPTTSCAVIGEGNLLLSCLRDLLDHNIEVKAVFSNTKCAHKLCDQQEIPCFTRNADLEAILSEKVVDYLFSISNPRILKENVLALPRKCTINYHDSPLPAYAGVHATSWAIINGEKSHGISWHVVEIGIDTGDILQRERVEILEEDSALTLNLKCVEAAKRTFKSLLNSILLNTVMPQKQESESRSYFGLHAIPENVGVLNFEKNAYCVYNMARGLELGNHENSLGSPKVKTSNGNFYLVTSARVGENLVQNGNNWPGQILSSVDDTLLVATTDRPIQLTIAKLDGSSILDSCLNEFGLYLGATLDNSFEINTNELLSVRKREAFWRKRMSVYEPTLFYRQKMNVVAGITDVSNDINVQTVEIPLPELSMVSTGDTDKMLASFVAFLARITCSEDVHVGLLAEKKDLPENCNDLYASVTPGIFSVDQIQDVSEVLEHCMKEFKTHTESRTFLTDMLYRYPELRGRKRSPNHNIVMGKADCKNMNCDKSVLRDCNILILFSEGSKVTIMYNERPAQDYSHVIDVLQHFTAFLHAIDKCKDSQQLKHIPLVSENVINTFYQPTNVSATIASRSKLLSKQVETQCRLTPLSLALKTTNNFLTYHKLCDEVGKLSVSIEALFRKQGNRKNIVALHLPNSVAYVVSLLAVLKCKNAFLPLPMDLPAERIVFTLKDANVRQMIMLQKDYKHVDMNGLTPLMRIVLKHQVASEEIIVVEFGKDQGSNFQNVGAENSIIERPTEESTEEDFAYVIYTSGSTGRPKGVKVRESSVINLARAQIKEWDLGPGDVIAQFASVGFDASISEIFTSILSGGTLAVLDKDERLGSSFVSSMNRMKVSVITLPPSALNIYSPADLPTLRKVVSAGEACTLNISMKWTSNGNVRFFNAYGPSEGTVCATCYEYLPGTIYEDVNRDIPIGKAIDGVRVYLFDDFMNPVPPDVVGEIFIGGKGLAQGYIGHASSLTKKKFVQNPLVKEKSLLYKTGDHAFHDVDGNLTFIGRMDDQVKIRGHRVDLSEIEQVLIQHSKIEMAVVVKHTCQQSNDISIAAFVAPTFVHISELREYLSKVLPKYMIPTYIKKLEVKDLPKTINGKVNRTKLEKDESVHAIIHADGHSHLNETQLIIAKFWYAVFKFDESCMYSLHRKSSFIELGGNSLHLVLIMRMIEDEFGISVSFTDIGIADTLEDFAEIVKRSQSSAKKSVMGDPNTKEELRELIFYDSSLANDVIRLPERKRFTQIKHHTTQIHRLHFRGHPKNILISGVTGFLGAFLLSEILEQSHANVCCMVREKTETRGMGRIIDNMRKYGLWKFEYSSRIAVVISDLSQKNMGIAPDIYKSLCNATDVVFMNAAMMNFNTPYEEHRVANVEGTKEFIRFARTGAQKYLFSTSSLSVFLFPSSSTKDTNNRQILSESDFFDDPLLIEGGYGQSKWASERLVMHALDSLPGGAIFRPARVSGRSTDGVAPRNDLFASTIIGMNKMGSYPEMDFPYDLTPVDYCAKAMVEISLKIFEAESGSFERVYHLFNSNTIPFKELFAGMNLTPLPLDTWRSELKLVNEDVKELISLTPFFMSEFWDRAPSWPTFGTVNTDSNISESTKELMKPTFDLLQVYKKFFGL